MDRPATGSWASQLVLNAAESKVSTAIKHELQTCTAFRFYVAFLNPSGVATLRQDLLDCARRGVRGRVLVSQYSNFTHPHALRMLMHLENLELRIETRTSMHAKGYFFERPDQERYIIGSSNWTDSGLARNQELNVICKTPSGSDFQQDVARLFDRVFEQATPVTEEYCRWYEGIWQPRPVVYVPRQRFPFGAVADVVAPSASGLPVPNSMQREGLKALTALRDRGESKGLVISATGTGKTYLSAFFAREVEASQGTPSRIPLFVKKDDDEGTDFYFLGEVHPIASSLREDRMPVKGNPRGVSVVRMDFRLDDPVPADLYHYLEAR